MLGYAKVRKARAPTAEKRTGNRAGTRASRRRLQDLEAKIQRGRQLPPHAAVLVELLKTIYHVLDFSYSRNRSKRAYPIEDIRMMVERQCKKHMTMERIEQIRHLEPAAMPLVVLGQAVYFTVADWQNRTSTGIDSVMSSFETALHDHIGRHHDTFLTSKGIDPKAYPKDIWHPDFPFDSIEYPKNPIVIPKEQQRDRLKEFEEALREETDAVVRNAESKYVQKTAGLEDIDLDLISKVNQRHQHALALQNCLGDTEERRVAALISSLKDIALYIRQLYVRASSVSMRKDMLMKSLKERFRSSNENDIEEQLSMLLAFVPKWIQLKQVGKRVLIHIDLSANLRCHVVPLLGSISPKAWLSRPCVNGLSQ